MGIDGIQGKRNELQVERQRGQRTGSSDRSGTQSPEREDSVELSADTLEFSRLRKLVDAAPDIRHDRVEQVKREISQGTYNVPASQIAEAILDEWM